MARPIPGETFEQFSARIEAEAFHWPLPLGENPGDPHYGKVPATIEKFDPSAFITDAGKFVLHWADGMLRWHAGQIAKAMEEGVDPSTVGLTPSTYTFVESSRDRLAQLLATLNNPDASEEARRQAIDEAIRTAFMIGESKGQLWQTLHGRRDMPRARAELMRMGKERAVEARLARERKAIKEHKWPFDGNLPKRLQGELGVEKRTGKLVPLSTIRRDVKELRAARHTSSVA
jgi:hypothetical protein